MCVSVKCAICGGVLDENDCHARHKAESCVTVLKQRLAAAEAENERLRGLLEPCRMDTDPQTDDSYPKTVNDVLSLLSAYIADFLPDDMCPGDEYFGAWERQARKVIGPLMESNSRLRGLLREACDNIGDPGLKWYRSARAALEGKP